ncbi:MAG: helix-turn-helix transcriptional regulator [Bacteroides sp.]|nr:helix-turn-helix transcriptional regulator [Bacteroides sp.]
MTDNKDLSILLGNGENGDSIYREYQAMEKISEGLSMKEIIDKAYPYYIKRIDIEKGMMLHRVIVSKYNDKLSIKDKLYCAVAYGNIGYYLIFERNNPLEAYPYLIKGLEIANQILATGNSPEPTKLINTIAAINTNLAKIFAIYKDYPRAMYYYRNAFDIAKRNNNSIAVPLSFTDLLHFVWTSDTLTSISNELIEVRSIKIPNNSLQSMCDYVNIMAEAGENYLKKNYDKALFLVDSASNKYDIHVDDRRCPVYNRIIAGKIAFAKKDYDKAAEYFTNAEKIIREEKLEDMYDLLYQLRTNFHTATGNPVLAEHYRNEGLRVRDSLHNLQSYSVIRDMELALQAKDYNEQLSDSRSEIQRWMYSTVCISILVLVICGLIVYILLKNRKLKKNSESLFRKNLELMEAQKRYEKVAGNDADMAQPMGERTREEDFNNEDLTKLYDQIIAYMTNNDDIFQPTFSMDLLADALGINFKLASKAINTIGGKNFNTLLGELRINKACEKMMMTYSDPSQRPTIEVIAYEVGYKSRTHFMRVFKSVTGLTTSEFLKQLKNSEDKAQ